MAATSSASRHFYFQMIIGVFFLLNNLHCCWSSLALAAAADTTTTNVYIVYLGERQQEDPESIIASHHDMLAPLFGSKEAARNSIVYSYKHGFSGFAASLSDSQAKAVAELPGVVLVFRNRIHKIHTTRSWDFLKLNNQFRGGRDLLSKTDMGDGTIVGIIDTGIWPESESFKDDGMGPIPSHWKGTCQTGQFFTSKNCNKKIIGARWFSGGYEKMYGPINTTGMAEYLSPRDKVGHGTHCASIAAGRLVPNASYDGLGRGVARGGAPLARLAIYKAAWFGISTDADVLMAFDMSIHDGVDILSMSFGRDAGGLPLPPYFDDGIAIGSFHAVAKGIPVVSTAGNDGPNSDTVGNTAPWIITVAATTIDRDFKSELTLGNIQPTFSERESTFDRAFNAQMDGEGGQSQTASANTVSSGGSNQNDQMSAETFSEADTGPNVLADDSSDACSKGSLNATLVKGKVVLCFVQPSSRRTAKELANVVADAGGVGVIYTQAHNDVLTPCTIPCLKVDFETGTNMFAYARSASSPVVRHSLPMTIVGKKVSPLVASFSSRGPNSLLPDVLKPDVAAPGVNILGAYPTPITGHPYEILSGTSMACPHVASVAALIKSYHKDWSPAAIKSAIMTTASQTGTDGQVIWAQAGNLKAATPFDMGGGNINPMRVAHPGLVYDISTNNYIQYLCSKGYTNEQMASMTKRNNSCSRFSSSMDLNLPSISIPYLENTITVTRKVTNVGPVNSVYRAFVVSPPGIGVKVEPDRLSFTASTKVLSFKVTFNSTQKVQLMDYLFGSLAWTDKKHLVRIPLAVRVAHRYSISHK